MKISSEETSEKQPSDAAVSSQTDGGRREKSNKRAGVMKAPVRFVQKNPVLAAALAAAVVTAFIVPPDAEYLGYFDPKTLSILFCVLAVVCAFKNINLFYLMARALVRRFTTIRRCVIAVVLITLVGSMIIANDMALLTFLPLSYYVLSGTGKASYAPLTFILQNFAANLGGMITPFGSPQNLYLYTKYTIPASEFLSIMALPFAVSVVMILLCCLFVKPEPIAFPEEAVEPLPKRKAIVYTLLFLLVVAVVFRLIPYGVGLTLIPAVLLVSDRKALAGVDYPLLATFAAFFVFSGNMARIGVVRDFVSALLERNTLLYAILSCQVISNVPAAILLSRFTENYRELLVGVNIGGVGTLIASLASLITLREFTKVYPSDSKKFLGLFHGLNVLFLLVLTAVMSVAYMK